MYLQELERMVRAAAKAIARARREKAVPTLAQVHHVLAAMPVGGEALGNDIADPRHLPPPRPSSQFDSFWPKVTNLSGIPIGKLAGPNYSLPVELH